jgi:hypothetical protein
MSAAISGCDNDRPTPEPVATGAVEAPTQGNGSGGGRHAISRRAEVPAPQLTVRRVPITGEVDPRFRDPVGYALVRWSLRRELGQVKPVALRLTIDSPTDHAGPGAFAIDVRDGQSGSKRLPIPLETGHRYKLIARAFSAHGAASSRVTIVHIPD